MTKYVTEPGSQTFRELIDAAMDAEEAPDDAA